MLRKLPLDLSTFRNLRNAHYLYVDKTKYAYEMLTGGRCYFLSRPRRFGKSLLVSTLKEILTGNRELFDDLWIATSDYRWEKHGVIELDLSTLGIDSPESFKTGICHALEEIVADYSLSVEVGTDSPELALRGVVKALYGRFGHVAILIDEYDNPILQAIEDNQKAKAMCETLRRFFSAIKGLGAFIDFVFITGVSSFARAGLFSGINNLRIIMLNEQFAGICGYTDDEVELYFSEHIKAWVAAKKIAPDILKVQIKDWYNGYHFGSSGLSVYNPFSLMHALEAQAFKNFWFQSGTPHFLIDELKKEYRKDEFRIFDPEAIEISEDSLGIFDVGATPIPALMFQTGYLTITSYNREKNLYALGYPNNEVRQALQKHLLSIFARLAFTDAEQLSMLLGLAFKREPKIFDITYKFRELNEETNT